MILKLPKWVLTNKFPAFHDVESLTAIEQTARVYGKINELIDNYNSFAENINKTLEEYARADQEEEEAFKTGLRQEFQDFINVVDLQIRELEQYVKVNLNAEIRKLWNDLNDNGDIQELINKTLEELITKADNIQLQWDRYRDELEQQYGTFEQNMNTKFDTLEHSVWNNFYDYKQEINTTVGTFDGRITANANELVSQNASIVGLSGTISNHTERLGQLDNVSSVYGGAISLLKSGGSLLNNAVIPNGSGMSLSIESLSNYTLVAVDMTTSSLSKPTSQVANSPVICFVNKRSDGTFYINGLQSKKPVGDSVGTSINLYEISIKGTISTDGTTTITDNGSRVIFFNGSANYDLSTNDTDLKIRAIIGLI